jgi:predicted outer membrane repeat protein
MSRCILARRLCPLALLLAALLAGSAEARADQVVTLCAFDNQAKVSLGDLNLSDAIALGGRITFRCGGRATIRFRQPHTLSKSTEIDGGKLITLDGGGWRMFGALDVRIVLRLVDIAIVNGGKAPRVPDPGFVGLFIPGGVVHGSLRVELIRSTIQRSYWAIYLTRGSARIEASRLSDNDFAVLVGENLEVVDHSEFSNNRGNPIYGRGGTIAIDRSDFFGNSVASAFVRCTLRITNSRYTSHTASGNGGALNVGCDGSIEESEFHNNRAAEGGAIFVTRAARRLELRAVKFTGNHAVGTGGAMSVEPSAIPLELTLRHVTFTDNTAQWGGAIALERSVGNTRSLNGVAVGFRGNQATTSGGAIYAPNASMRLSRAVFAYNKAATTGGAIAAVQQGPRDVQIANSLLVHNIADSGSAFWGNAATFINSTIADNGARAIFATERAPTPFPPPAGTPTTFPLRFRNTILSGSGSGACGPSVTRSPYQDDGENLQSPGLSCGSSIPSGMPWLGPYYVPLDWSPAIEGGNDAVCAASPIDRKDFYLSRRPLTTHCTIGAVEGSIWYLIERWRKQRADNLTYRRAGFN